MTANSKELEEWLKECKKVPSTKIYDKYLKKWVEPKELSIEYIEEHFKNK